MWVMTTRGFYSVVAHREHPTKVMIRARCKRDIDALVPLIAAVDEEATEPYAVGGDYAWRLVCSSIAWTAALTELSSEIDYPNFKSAVKDRAHHDAYMKVWSALLRLDDRDSRSGRQQYAVMEMDYDEPNSHLDVLEGDRAKFTATQLNEFPPGSIVSAEKPLATKYGGTDSRVHFNEWTKRDGEGWVSEESGEVVASGDLVEWDRGMFTLEYVGSVRSDSLFTI